MNNAIFQFISNDGHGITVVGKKVQNYYHFNASICTPEDDFKINTGVALANKRLSKYAITVIPTSENSNEKELLEETINLGIVMAEKTGKFKKRLHFLDIINSIDNHDLLK